MANGNYVARVTGARTTRLTPMAVSAIPAKVANVKAALIALHGWEKFA